MIFDVTKVTYNMYSYEISCMSREMMEMDGRECATCKNPKERTYMSFLKLLMIVKTK